MTRTSATLFACVVFSLVALQPANADFLVNGNFESPNINGPGFREYDAGGATTLPGWTVQSYSVYLQWGYTMPVNSNAGPQYLNLLSLNSAGAGVVNQLVSVTSGATYKLSFDFGGGIDQLGNTFYGDSTGNTLTYQLYDGLTGKTLSQGSVLIQKANLDIWTNLSIQATATSSSLGVRFASDGQGNDGYFGPFIDGASLNPALSVPEPSSFCLVGIAGLLSLAYHLRRR